MRIKYKLISVLLDDYNNLVDCKSECIYSCNIVHMFVEKLKFTLAQSELHTKIISHFVIYKLCSHVLSTIV